MTKKATAITAGSAGVAGYLFGNLTSSDISGIATTFLNGFFQFLQDQGQYASFALLAGGAFLGITIWSIKSLIRGKDEEIERLVEERDKIQQLFISEWKSSRGSNGK